MNDASRKLIGIGRTTLFLFIAIALMTGCAGKNAAMKKSADVSMDTVALKKITGVSYSEDADTVVIKVTGSQDLTYTSVKQPEPPGVLLYFPNTGIASGTDRTGTVTGSDVIDGVDLSVVTEKGSTARLAITLKKDVPYTVDRGGSGLTVSFNKPSFKAETAKRPSTGSPSLVQPSAAATTAQHLESISAAAHQEGVEIQVQADGIIKDYKSFTIKNPARIVFDVFNVKSATDKEQQVSVDSPMIKQIRHYGYPDRVRIVLDTEEQYLTRFSSAPQANGLSIVVGSASHPQPAKLPIAKTAGPSIINTGSSGPAWVNRIDFSSEDNGKSTIVIGTTAAVTYEMTKATEKRLQLILSNTRLPDYRRRPLVTTRFESAVDRVTPIQPKGSTDTSMIIIELREAVPYFVEQTDNLLMVHFEPSSVPPQPMDTAGLPAWQQVVEEGMPAPAEAPRMAAEAPMAEEMPAETEIVSGKGKVYTGEKIALDFYETDIKNVFRILREISGKNFAVDRDVSGEVTLSLDKPVPWDQVLDLILKMNQLGMTMEGDIVRIATLETISRDRELAASTAEAEQETAAKEKALEPLVTEYIPVNYASATADVLPHIVTTPERGSVTVDERNNQIIVTDTAEMVKLARETVLSVDKVTPQVMIEARIVEASKTFSRDFGTQWQSTAGPIFNNEFLNLVPEGALDLSMSATNPVAGLGQIGINFTKLTGTPFSIVNAQLTASESQGLIKIISSPRILTLDNKAATIKQGLAYPLTQLDADGNTTTAFQDVALELVVTPHVTPDNRIAMEVNIKNNEIGAVINNATSFTTKEAQTELLVNDGDTVIIGGIRKTTKRDGESGVPVLKNIPLMGWLFKNQTKADDLEELLIFITPKIVLLKQRN